MKPYINQTMTNLKLLQENERLRAENAKLRGDVDFIAIMADVDLETDEEVAAVNAEEEV